MYQQSYRDLNDDMNCSKNLIDLLIEAMKDERHDRAKYKMMMDMTKKEKIKEQINFAYEDEGKHYKMFQYIFYQLTGKQIDIPIPEVEEYDELIDAVETSINGELGAVELYRKIQSMLPNIGLRDMLFEIITDEQEHATRFTYVFSMLNED
ncbi:ferritin-like domain-containing protein [Clostridium tunisiense]|uniref:ferritin-like domain-containing protein n=1 Tax=Clostridium tunisiense TaxID=219748 RepID=UPI00031C0ECE|nr:ferritin-like domain-containing protein [Clostridium tunisiense]